MAGFFYNFFVSCVQVFHKFDIHVVFNKEPLYNELETDLIVILQETLKILLLILILLLLSGRCPGPAGELTAPPDPSLIEWSSVIKW